MIWIAFRDGSPVMVFATKTKALDYLDVPKSERKEFPTFTEPKESVGYDYIVKTTEWSLW